MENYPEANGQLPAQSAQGGEGTPAATYQDLSRMVGLPLADGALTEEQIFAGCGEANRLELGETIIRPSDVDLAKHWIHQPDARMACLTGFPGGSSTTPARLYEARDVLRRGVKHLVVTINLGKLASRKFLYLESELLQLAENCRQNEARLRVLFEVEHLQQDHMLIAVRLCKRTAVQGMDLYFRTAPRDFITGVVRYVLHHAKQKLDVAVHAPVMSLDAAFTLRDAGVTRLLTPQASSLLGEWKAELEHRRQEEEARRSAAKAETSPPPPSS